MTPAQLILWSLQALNIAAFIYMQVRAGHFTHKGYLLYCGATMLGQAATATEGYLGGAFGVAVTQGFFFFMTIVGGVKRYREMVREGAAVK